MWKPIGWDKIKKEACYAPDFYWAFETGADAMHKADVEWIKEHSYLLKYVKEGEVEITIKVVPEDWQVFTGGEIV